MQNYNLCRLAEFRYFVSSSLYDDQLQQGKTKRRKNLQMRPLFATNLPSSRFVSHRLTLLPVFKEPGDCLDPPGPLVPDSKRKVRVRLSISAQLGLPF
jgi:hypothetical protein